jgi:hypothetical protein
MKRKFVLAMALFGAAAAANAGSFSWEFNNKTNAYSDDEVRAIVQRAIKDGPKDTSSLNAPWYLRIYVAGGSMNDDTPQPGIIIVEKAKSAGKDGYVTKCRKLNFGTYSRSHLATTLYDVVQTSTGYATGHSDCK